jgi:hypothetical protein
LDVTTQPKEPEEIAANLAIYAANCISIDHFLCLIIISSHSLLIKSEKLEFFSKIHKKSSTNKNLSYEYFDSILLITKKTGANLRLSSWKYLFYIKMYKMRSILR